MEVERILSCETAEVAVIELREDNDHVTLCSDVDFESRWAVFHCPWHWCLDPPVCDDGPARVEKEGTIDLTEFVHEVIICCR